jgi:hypothetical protein
MERWIQKWPSCGLRLNSAQRWHRGLATVDFPFLRSCWLAALPQIMFNMHVTLWSILLWARIHDYFFCEQTRIKRPLAAWSATCVCSRHAGRRRAREGRAFSPTVSHPDTLKCPAVSAQASGHSSGCEASTLIHALAIVHILNSDFLFGNAEISHAVQQACAADEERVVSIDVDWAPHASIWGSC